MPAENLGKRAKKMVFSALTEVLGHKPTLRKLEETARETRILGLLVPDDGREIGCCDKEGVRVGIKAEVILPSGEQILAFGWCVFEKPKHKGDLHRPNSIWLDLDGEKCDFYAPKEDNLFRLEGAKQT